VLVPAMKFLADNMSNIFKLAGVVGVALLTAFASAIASFNRLLSIKFCPYLIYKAIRASMKLLKSTTR
jgi:hypothetical protein